MANQWFRLYGEFANDPKVQMMTEVNQRRLVMLMCIKSCNASATLHETGDTEKSDGEALQNVSSVFSDAAIAFQLRISMDDWLASKAVFLANNFIDSGNVLLNWDKRQFVSDSSTERVRKHRVEKKKAETFLKRPARKKKHPKSVPATPPDTESYTESYTDIKDPPTPRSMKPSISEVDVLAKEEGWDLEGFFVFYEKNDWHVGKGEYMQPVADWKSVARGWAERRRKENAGKVAVAPYVKTKAGAGEAWHHDLGD